MKDIEQIPMAYENYLDFSNPQLLKNAVAFANTRGGVIAIGANDSDSIDGIPSPSLFHTLDAIEEAIIDSCDPPIIPDLKVQEIDGKNILLLHIPKGMQRPYCIKNEGLLDGVYVRVDGRTRRVSRYLVQDFILQGQNRHYDQEIATDQIISEKTVNALCADMYTVAKDNAEGKPIKPPTKEQLIDWKLLTEEEEQLIPKRGFLLLEGSSSIDSDAQIQCALFKGTSRATFLDRRDLTGPLYRQVQVAYAFVMQHIELCSYFESGHRKERFELPDDAIRELIAFVVCQRNYLFPEKIQIALYDDRLEITVPGMIYDDLTIEKMKNGISRLNNPAVTNAFIHMGLIKNWGNSIPRLLELTKEYNLPEPSLESLGFSLRINIFRQQSLKNNA